MATVKGPLMSIDAAGTIGRLLTFAKVNGGLAAKRSPRVAQPRTPLQRSFRALFSWLTTQWPLLDAPTKASWTAYAAATHQTPQQAYQRVNFDRWKNGNTPQAVYPPSDSLAVGQVAPNIDFIGHDFFTYDCGTLNPPPPVQWGFVLLLSQSPIAGVLTEAAGFTDRDDGTAVISRLNPGHYFSNALYVWMNDINDGLGFPDTEFDIT